MRDAEGQIVNWSAFVLCDTLDRLVRMYVDDECEAGEESVGPLGLGAGGWGAVSVALRHTATES